MSETTGLPSKQEAVEALTGWDEIAIAQCCGRSVHALSLDPKEGGDGILLVRVVAAALLAREAAGGGPHNPTEFKKAYHEVMALKQSEVQARFYRPDDEEPAEGDAGKDERSVSTSAIEQPSASQHELDPLSTTP